MALAPLVGTCASWNPKRETTVADSTSTLALCWLTSLARPNENNLAARHANSVPACRNLVHDEFGFWILLPLSVLAQSELYADVEPGDVACERRKAAGPATTWCRPAGNLSRAHGVPICVRLWTALRRALAAALSCGLSGLVG